MNAADRDWSLFHAAMTALLLVLVGRYLFVMGEPPGYRTVALLIGAVFFAMSIPASVRTHDAYHAVSAAFTTVVFALTYLDTGSTTLGAFAALTAVGTLVEIYNYRYGTEYLRLR